MNSFNKTEADIFSHAGSVLPGGFPFSQLFPPLDVI